MSFIDVLPDTSNDSTSVMFTIKIEQYLHLAERIYEQSGGIEGQRSALKTKSAQQIRKRMVSDIGAGAVLPPIVLGVVASLNEIKDLSSMNDVNQILAWFQSKDENTVSIIDGMQRTTAILEAKVIHPQISTNPVRIEIWVSCSIQNLIYRMLVLNTGQIPWDIKRQLTTIYKPIINHIKNEVDDIAVIGLDEGNRRVQSGQFNGGKLIEYFLAFTSRKTNIDIKDKIAEDFARMAATEATSKYEFLDDFIQMLNLMVKLDKAFGKAAKTDVEGKIKSGKDIFTSVPAGVGFLVAAAIYINGRPGLNYDDIRKKERFSELKLNVNGVVTKLNGLSPEEVLNFIELDLLNEKLSSQSSKVGEFERQYYMKAFEAMFEVGNSFLSMEPAWIAY
jgi:hypothetical protein